MKKITKLCKIFLVLATIFSNLSSVVTVLAEEILSKPLTISLSEDYDSENDCVRKYDLYYISENNDYEEYVDSENTIEKTYDIVLSSSFTYLNNTTSDVVTDRINDVTGKTLNSTRSKYELDPISKYYNGTFNVNVTVLDGESTIYEKKLTYTVTQNRTGLNSYLSFDTGFIYPVDNSFKVTEANLYSTNYLVGVGQLNPFSTYRLVYSDGAVSEEMTAEEIRSSVLTGENIDLSHALYGEYNTNYAVIIEEVDNEEVVNTYSYENISTITFEGDNNSTLNNVFNGMNLILVDNYMTTYVYPELSDITIPTIGEIIEKVNELNSEIECIVTLDNGEELDLSDSNNLNIPIKNGYKFTFTSGSSISYDVVVVGDVDGDNMLTKTDLLETMSAYINEEVLISMDYVGNDEEIGTIGFNDVMYFNDLLKSSDEKVEYPIENSNFNLEFSEISSDVFVGDTFDLSIVVNTDNTLDYIDGISALLSTNENLELVDIKFNDKLLGTYNDAGKIVAAGDNITGNGTIVMTFTLRALGEGEGVITLTGNTAKYLMVGEIEELSKTINIKRNISTNNNLSKLYASVGNFDKSFDKDVTEYTLTVPENTKSVILYGLLEDENATVDGLIEYELNSNETMAYVTVYAEDGSYKVYTIRIVKEVKNEAVARAVSYQYSSNNYLKVLEVTGYKIDFNKDTSEYKITVSNDVTDLDIKAIAEDSHARVEITGNEKFKVGRNVVTITVSAEDGTTREYKLIVNRESENKDVLTELDGSSNTAEKVVIIILIILVVLGLLYLIFKKDDEDTPTINDKKVDNKNNSNKDK